MNKLDLPPNHSPVFVPEAGALMASEVAFELVHVESNNEVVDEILAEPEPSLLVVHSFNLPDPTGALPIMIRDDYLVSTRLDDVDVWPVYSICKRVSHGIFSREQIFQNLKDFGQHLQNLLPFQEPLHLDDPMQDPRKRGCPRKTFFSQPPVLQASHSMVTRSSKASSASL